MYGSGGNEDGEVGGGILQQVLQVGSGHQSNKTGESGLSEKALPQVLGQDGVGEDHSADTVDVTVGGNDVWDDDLCAVQQNDVWQSVQADGLTSKESWDLSEDTGSQEGQ